MSPDSIGLRAQRREDQRVQISTSRDQEVLTAARLSCAY
jgi:hypothetical protein